MNDTPLGDMPPDEFREYGHQLIDWIADYLENTDRYPVLSKEKPGELKAKIPNSPPFERNFRGSWPQWTKGLPRRGRS